MHANFYDFKSRKCFFLEISTLRQIFYDLLLTFQSLDPIPRLDNNLKTEKKRKQKTQTYQSLATCIPSIHKIVKSTAHNLIPVPSANLLLLKTPRIVQQLNVASFSSDLFDEDP